MMTIPELCVACLKEWNDVFEFKTYDHVDNVPKDVIKLRYRLIDEEAKEYYAAVDLVDELDAICDLLYVIVGTNVTCNIPVVPYTSGQLYRRDARKGTIFEQITPVLQELGSLFPCPRRTHEYTNKAIVRLLDVAAIRGFKLRDAFRAVHDNNMAKLWPEHPGADKGYIVKPKGNKFLVKNQYGKVIKSPAHTKVDLTPFI